MQKRSYASLFLCCSIFLHAFLVVKARFKTDKKATIDNYYFLFHKHLFYRKKRYFFAAAFREEDLISSMKYHKIIAKEA